MRRMETGLTVVVSRSDVVVDEEEKVLEIRALVDKEGREFFF